MMGDLMGNSFAALSLIGDGGGDSSSSSTTTTTTTKAPAIPGTGTNHSEARHLSQHHSILLGFQSGEIDFVAEEDKGKNRKKGKKEQSNGSPLASSDSASGTYKLPLVWIDLEMTGLDVEVDRILEVACIITNGKLTQLVEGPNLVIHQSEDCLDKMGEWCQEHHRESGLIERVLKSKLTEKEAEQQVMEFVKKHVGTYTPLLAGNSVYTDYLFLKKYMPDLAGLFHHNLVDVSSVKALCIRWFYGDYKRKPSKERKHRALDDIKESIQELKYYKDSIFKHGRKSEA